MNKHCQLFYKRLRILFPSIGFAEGKFLRDIKMQLRDFSIENPGSDYEDVVAFFGSPEEVYVDYIQNRGRNEVYSKFQRRKQILVKAKILFIVFLLFLIIFFIFWCRSYQIFNQNMLQSEQTFLEEGDIKP